MGRDYDNDFANPLPLGRHGSAMRERYYDKEMELKKAFREALEVDSKAQGLPKSLRDAMFESAWSDGHACGYNEVASYYQTLVWVALKAFEAGIAKGKE